jgi:hypothetical protein
MVMRKSLTLLLAVLFCLNLFAQQTKPSAGDGSKENPYQIGNAQELLWFAGKVNGTLEGEEKNVAACAELTDDIDLSEVCGEEIGSWHPIGIVNNSYAGIFDGKGYGIKNLYLEETSTEIIGQGFFGVTNSATISNLSILSGSVSSKGVNIGGVVGNGYQSTITNCHNYISVTGGKFTGGIVGYANSSYISKCHNEGRIKLFSDFGCGGICGATYGATLSYCYNIGEITGYSREGSLVGSHEKGSLVKNSFSYNSSVPLIGYNNSSSTSRCYINNSDNILTSYQFASGEICYLLNADSISPVFFQSIGVDKYPVLNGNEIVVKDEDKYYNVSLSICEHGDSTYVDPTCTSCGLLYCTKCDKLFDTVPSLPHDTTIEVTKPTCTALGYSTAKCDRCGLKLYDYDTVPVLGHDTTIVVKKPTCTKVGYSTAKCSKCGLKHYNNDTVPALGHDTTIVVTNPTCTKVGYSTAKCSMCGLKHYNYDTVPALGHDTIKRSLFIEATCTLAGYYSSICSRCPSILREYVGDPLGHDSVFTRHNDPTCTDAGRSHYNCSRCNKYFLVVNSKTEPALGHDTTEYHVAATCTHNGYMQPSCLRCKATLKEVMLESEPALGHDSTHFVHYDADCTNPGTMAYTCERCGTKWSKTIDNEPATGVHFYENGLCHGCLGSENKLTIENDTAYIYSAGDLFAFMRYAKSYEHRNTNAKIMNDILVNSADSKTKPAENIPFGTGESGPNGKDYNYYNGLFDGQGHEISGMRGGSLIKYANSSVIKNLGLEGVFSAPAFVENNDGIIDNCHLKGKVYSYAGFCRSGSGLISNSYNQADIISLNDGHDERLAAGIIAYGYGVIDRCWNEGSITGKNACGINAWACGNTFNCYNIGKITGSHSASGIVYSSCECSLTQNCYNLGTLVSPNKAEILVDGCSPDDMQNCFYSVESVNPAMITKENIPDSNAVAMPLVSFENGEVFNLLNTYIPNHNHQSAYQVTYKNFDWSFDSNVWYQTIGMDKYPRLDQSNGSLSGIHDAETNSLVTLVVNRQVIVIGVDSFRIFNMLGHDVTASNGSLADGVYVVVVDGNVAKVIVK